MKKQVTILLLSACALVPAAAAGVPALAQTSQPALETVTTSGGIGTAVFAQAEAAGDIRRAYRRWRRKLDHYGVPRGRNLAVAARSQQRPPTARELRRSIHRMHKRFHRFLRTPEGRAVAFRCKVRRIPNWGKQHLESIAACESHGNPRAVGGGGAYRGMYQFSFSIWRVVGGSGDPAAASRHEQTWRAWLLLSRHGAGQWPICG